MWRLHSSLAVLALGGLMLATERGLAAADDWGPGHQGPYWGGGGYSGGRSYRSRSFTPAPTYDQAPTTSQSFFNTPVQDNRTVLINIQVPANAQVWFDDDATQQSGSERLFVSPRLTPGKMFEYQIRAQWNDNGKKVEQTKRVTFQAGDRIHLNFNSVE